MQPKAIFFDLDGTLMDSAGAIRVALTRACEEIARVEPRLSVEGLLLANREAFAGYWPQVAERWTLGLVGDAAVGLEVWRRTFHACGYGDEALATFAQQSLSRLAREAECPYDDVTDVLNRLKSRFRLAVITNGADERQRQKLRADGLNNQFDAIVTSGGLGVAKPDPAIFQAALERLGLSPGDAWHVGDSLALDVGGAKGAGLTAVWINRTAEAHDPDAPSPDYEIKSLADLLELLP